MNSIPIEEASVLSLLAKAKVLGMDMVPLYNRLRTPTALVIAEGIVLGSKTGMSGSYLEWAEKEIRKPV